MDEISMLERVAQSQLDRFIERGLKRLGGPAFVPGTKLAALPASYRDDFMEDAKAAIEAMREPTPSMLADCWPLHHPWGKNAPKPEERPEGFQQMTENVRADWSAMIDAALTPR